MNSRDLTTRAKYVSKTVLTCPSPSSESNHLYLNMPLEVSIAVSNVVMASSSSSTIPAFTFTLEPTVLGLIPSAGSSSGGEMVTFFLQNTEISSMSDRIAWCKFGTNTVVGTYDNNMNTISCTAPARPSVATMSTSGNYTVSVSVSTNGVDFSSEQSKHLYTYSNEPFLLSVAPRSGPLRGGTMITLYGSFPFHYRDIKCIFEGLGNTRQLKRAMVASRINGTAVMCKTPSNEISCTSSIKLRYGDVDLTLKSIETHGVQFRVL